MATIQLFVLALLTTFAWNLIVQSSRLRDNLKIAEKIGLPYTVVPVFFQNPLWLPGQELLFPLLDQLPKTWTESWLPILVMKRIWHNGYSPFARMKADTFIAVACGGNTLWTCDPEVIQQISHRGHDFPKSLDVIQVLNLFGPTITATEGAENRVYRKLATSAMNDFVHRKVWVETLSETAQVIKHWCANPRFGHITRIRHEIDALALHVLSSCAFNSKMDWTAEDKSQPKLSAGHTLSYTQAMTRFLRDGFTVFLTPHFLLRNSPLSQHQQAWQAFVETKTYMEEMREQKTTELKDLRNQSKEKDVLTSFVSASISNGSIVDVEQPTPKISDSAVIGNIFIIFLAGHHASANAAETAITLLACFPSIQRALQTELDEVLGDRPPEMWSYEDDFPRLLNGYIGATLNETLRLYTVVPFLPKEVSNTPQSIKVQGRTHILPPKTLVITNTNATHRNPKYWPEDISKKMPRESIPFPVSSFNPEIWLDKGEKSSSRDRFTPVPGSYIPFAEGARACIGQRFAKVEFVALIARIFKFHSVELELDENVKLQDPRRAWKEAQARCIQELSEGVIFHFALKMGKGVPLHVVRRGEEAYFDKI